MTRGIRPEIRQVIDEHREAILAFLSELVACNSFSHNKAGVDEMGKMVAREMPEHFSHRVVKNDRLGDHHVYSSPRDDAPAIVLAGHLDILCPEDSDFRNLADRGDTLLGPGVNDMKGGDVVMIWALKTLDALGLLKGMPIVCIFNGDEELGSPTSRTLFSDMRGRASFALVFECGGPEGTVVTTRKGISRYRLHLTGKPGHFGNLRGPKISAIEELANKTLAVETLNRPDGALVANVGRVEGGLAANAVAEQASMDFEIRYWDEKTGQEAQARIGALAGTPAIPGCVGRLERLSYRPAMQPTPESMRLFNTIVEVARALGQRIVEEKRGGVSDACILSHAGIPTIDGLGPLGDNDFTPDEYIVTESLFDRIELAANLLLHLAGSAAVL